MLQVDRQNQHFMPLSIEINEKRERAANRRFRAFLFVSGVVIIVLLLLLTWQTYRYNEGQMETNRWVTHTHRVLYSSQKLLTTIVDAETANRGFVITGNDTYLDPLQRAHMVVRGELSNLESLTSDNQEYRVVFQQLRSLIERKMAWSDSVVQVRTSDASVARWLISSQYGKKLMDSIRMAIHGIQEAENGLLRKRSSASAAQVAAFSQLFTVTQALLLFLVIALMTTVLITLSARRRASLALRQASLEISDLYDNAPSGYFSVNASLVITNINQTLLKWLGYQREEVVGKFRYEDLLTEESKKTFLASFEKDFEAYERNGSVSDLEFEYRKKDGGSIPVMVSSVAVLDEDGKFIKSRSSVADYTEQKRAIEKIIQLNSELEAFTYSVSHDLRAPLRTITGYSQMILEDYKEKIDAEQMRLVTTVSNGARRMAQLIDDLLEFSRVGRKDMQKVTVNTNDLVASVIHDLRQQTNGHVYEVAVDDLPECRGDLSLLRQVWVNLLSNAIKYSSKTSRPSIRVHAIQETDRAGFCVEDNGVGFDMKHSQKLFGVFQRLHKMTDFEGTGVGLALVKRIIDRHGGKIWADAAVGQGARFYFTLPQN